MLSFICRGWPLQKNSMTNQLKDEPAVILEMHMFFWENLRLQQIITSEMFILQQPCCTSNVINNNIDFNTDYLTMRTCLPQLTVAL